MLRFLLKHTPLLASCLFANAGVYKLLNPGEATMALQSLDVPYRWANLIVIAVTILELYLGTILLAKIDLRWGMALAMGTMLLFAVYMWYLSTLANPPSCGCLGLTGIFNSNKHAALFGLVQNCLILWALKFSYAHHFNSSKAEEVKQELQSSWHPAKPF